MTLKTHKYGVDSATRIGSRSSVRRFLYGSHWIRWTPNLPPNVKERNPGISAPKRWQSLALRTVSSVHLRCRCSRAISDRVWVLTWFGGTLSVHERPPPRSPVGQFLGYHRSVLEISKSWITVRQTVIKLVLDPQSTLTH